MQKMEEKIYLISVNMGYGHRRTAFSLKELTQKIICANDYDGIPNFDKEIWEQMRKFYEAISNFYRFPFVGKIIFSFYDQLQKILAFYPKRDLSKPNFQLKIIYFLLKKGWGKNLIEKLKEKNLPLISTFFIPVFMAEYFNYSGEIFCVVCDADIARPWTSLNPKESKIKYFVPNQRTAGRLKLYGVKRENIFLTGYPLPQENIGGRDMEILKQDLKFRILNLDPQKKYFEKYKILIEKKLGKLPTESDHPLTIMFSIGGAGAQKEILIKILKCLKPYLEQKQIKIILSVGTKEKTKNYLEKNIEILGFKNYKENGDFSSIEIIFEKEIETYFQKFNLALRKTDILWTKPSELSFYCALGIPIIISLPVGSHEECNMKWLLRRGFGIFQEDLNFINEWLFDWLKSGCLAEVAMEGFIKGEKFGTLNIQKILKQKTIK
jgi:hypothetical protein